MSDVRPPGRLLVVSGPGGVGKGTVVAAFVNAHDDVAVSISATTRPIRSTESEGVHYHFVDRPTFEHMIAADGFLEWAEFNGNYYGTPWSSIIDPLRAGTTVVLEIDVQGAHQVRDRARTVGDIDPTLVFLLPPDVDELEQRLRGRGTEDEDLIRRRLQIGRDEMAQAETFDHQVVNQSVQGAVAELERILGRTVES